MSNYLLDSATIVKLFIMQTMSAHLQLRAMRLFLNSAHYLGVGQKLWVNRAFSIAVLNAMYDLHASASGWIKIFNDTYGNEGLKLS
jgi:CxC5 like cysteine cluster associated with KDZ transposases